MISSLVSYSVALPTKIILEKSRHGSAEINARYQVPSKGMQHQARIAVFEKFEDKAKDQLETPDIDTSDFAFVLPDVNKSVGISTPIYDPTVDCKVVLMSATAVAPPAAVAPAPVHYNSHPPQTRTSTHLQFWSAGSTTFNLPFWPPNPTQQHCIFLSAAIFSFTASATTINVLLPCSSSCSGSSFSNILSSPAPSHQSTTTSRLQLQHTHPPQPHQNTVYRITPAPPPY